MKVMLNLRTMLGFLGNLELETMALILLGILTTPFVIRSIGILLITIIRQLFWVGFGTGLLLIIVSAMCWIWVGIKRSRSATNPERVTCTPLDVVLSILFQAGIQFPTWLWDRLMNSWVDEPARRMDEQHRILTELAFLSPTVENYRSGPEYPMTLTEDDDTDYKSSDNEEYELEGPRPKCPGIQESPLVIASPTTGFVSRRSRRVRVREARGKGKEKKGPKKHNQ